MDAGRALAASIAAAMAVFANRPAEAQLTRTYVIVDSGERRHVDEKTFYRLMPSCTRVEVRREPRSDVVTYLCYREPGTPVKAL